MYGPRQPGLMRKIAGKSHPGAPFPAVANPLPSHSRRGAASCAWVGLMALAGGLVTVCQSASGQPPAPPPPVSGTPNPGTQNPGAPAGSGAPSSPPPPAPAAAGAAASGVVPKKDPVERLSLETTDGIRVSAWSYPVFQENTSPPDAATVSAGPPPVVILIHDLEGSHLSVEPLAKSLQKRGVAVVAPDLRGHGESLNRQTPAGDVDTVEAKTLKKLDFEMIARTRGGQMRDQSAVRGDIECVRNWIKQQADAGRVDMQRLFVVGSGLGATLAAIWAVEDAAWPDLASGPQGRQVRGLVLVSPVFTARGFSVAPALGSVLIRKLVPIMVIAGADDRDALKVFEQLKRQRPEAWFEKLAAQPAPTANPRKAQDGAETLFMLQLDTPLSGDRLASYRSPDARRSGLDPDTLIEGFISKVAPATKAP